MRLSPPGFLRFGQARSFDVIYGGGEANVAVSLANFGVPVDYVTRLPDNDLGEACLQFLRQYGVGVDKIVRGGERLGIYFLEMGAVQRGSKVIYDRANSAIATIERGHDRLASRSLPTPTGSTGPASRRPSRPGPRRSAWRRCKTAKEMGLTVSCDLNYRKKLWKWGKAPGEVMPELVAYCDVAVGNEEDADKVFGIKAPDTDVTAGRSTRTSTAMCARNWRTLPEPQDGRHHPAWFALGQPQYLVGGAVGRRMGSTQRPPMTSRTSWTAWVAATRFWPG